VSVLRETIKNAASEGLRFLHEARNQSMSAMDLHETADTAVATACSSSRSSLSAVGAAAEKPVSGVGSFHWLKSSAFHGALFRQFVENWRLGCCGVQANGFASVRESLQS
jgi:hypothetical protein